MSTTPKKRPIQLSGKFTFAVRKRGTLDAKGYSIDIAMIAETKSGREVAIVMDQKTFRNFVIDATAQMWRCEHGDRPQPKLVTPTGLVN